MNVMGHMSARTFLLKKPIPSGMIVKPSQGQEEQDKEAHIDVFCLQVSCQSTPKMPILCINYRDQPKYFYQQCTVLTYSENTQTLK